MSSRRQIPRLSIALLALVTAGCASSIWNAGDLAEWVKDQAVDDGILRQSIQLDDWLVEESGRQVWKGTGIEESSGQSKSFAIPVDKVWKPSS